MEKQYFKVGDKVTCCMYGKGNVAYLDYNIKNGYVMQVRFPSPIGIRDYTGDGRLNINGRRVLYQGHIDIPEPELKEIVTFKAGEYVWVKNYNCNNWKCRKFLRFTGSLAVCCSQSELSSIEYNWDMIRKYKDRPF